MANDTDIFGPATETGKPSIRDADIFGTFAAGATQSQPVNVIPTMKDSLREEMAGRPVGAALAGAGTVLDNAALRLKQLFSGLTPADESKVRHNRDLLSASPYALGGNIAGNAALGAIAGPSVAGNAAVGAGAGYFGQPIMPGESGAGNAVMGGAFGAAGGVAGKLMTGSPVVNASPQVQQLLGAGVVPTVGQAASSSPSKAAQALGRVEEQAMSVPVVGHIIGASRRRALEEFNRAAISKGMPPGQAVTTAGDEGVALAKAALGSAYDDIYKNAQVAIDPMLLQGVAAAKNSTTVPLNQAGAKQFDGIMKKYLWDRLPAGSNLPARDAKIQIEGDLGKAAHELRMSSIAAERSVGEALGKARDAFRDLMARNLPPDDAARLAPVDKAYANYANVRTAAEKAKAQNGVFSPYQLQASSRPGTDMRGFADAGQAVLAGRVPNSGTTDRALIAGMLAPGAAGFYLGMPMLGALGAAPAAYSRTGARWLLGDVTNPAIQGLSPYIAQGLRAYEEQQNKR
jgi:hypothetical protein